MPEINFEDLGRTISNAAENVSRKTEAFIESQRLKTQINSAERSAEKAYKDLGELVFQRYAIGEAVDEEVAVICEEISHIHTCIAELKALLASKRGCRICQVCEAEVSADAAYCMKCGSKIVVEEPPAEEDIVEFEEAEVIVEEEPEVKAEEEAEVKAEEEPESQGE